MARVSFFIDGFNLYHAVAEKDHLRHYRWINLRNLANCFIRPTDSLSDIFYFTALAHWDPNKVKRHKIFIRIQEHLGVRVIYGEFRKTQKRCRKCGCWFETFEEKETDVNIAIQLFEQAYHDSYDTAIVISGDSDQLPAIRAVKREFPSKSYGVVIPPEKAAELLKRESDFHRKIKLKHLQHALLPERVALPDGNEIECPANWRSGVRSGNANGVLGII